MDQVIRAHDTPRVKPRSKTHFETVRTVAALASVAIQTVVLLRVFGLV